MRSGCHREIKVKHKWERAPTIWSVGGVLSDRGIRPRYGTSVLLEPSEARILFRAHYTLVPPFWEMPSHVAGELGSQSTYLSALDASVPSFLELLHPTAVLCQRTEGGEPPVTPTPPEIAVVLGVLCRARPVCRPITTGSSVPSLSKDPQSSNLKDGADHGWME